MSSLFGLRCSGTVTSFVASMCQSGLNSTKVRSCPPLCVIYLFILCDLFNGTIISSYSTALYMGLFAWDEWKRIWNEIILAFQYLLKFA